jgi:hypothetical protein
MSCPKAAQEDASWSSQLEPWSTVLTRHRPQLPPVSFLDHDKLRRDEDGYQDRMTGVTQILLPSVPAASPAHQYPSGPPPPYSHPAPPTQYLTGAATSTPTTMRTPPESRRTSGDEKEAIKQTVRQSLPSISEALGVDNQPAYHSSLPTQTMPAAHPPTHRAVPTSSPSPRSQHRMEPPQHAPKHHAPTSTHYPQYRQDTPQHHSYPPVEAPRPPYAESRPSMHIQAARSPPPQRPAQHASQYPPSALQSPGREQPPQHSSGSMGPLPFSYGYQPYPPRHAQPPPPSSSSTGPIYQPSVSNAAPSTSSTAWKSESKYGGETRSYGDSVKRQLDMYDLEGALNDVR